MMKNVPTLILSLLMLGFAPLAVADETPLEKEMATISSAYKQLGRQARREKYDFDRLTELFTAAKKASDKSAELVPEKLKDLEGEAKDKAMSHYKKEMAALSKQIEGILASLKAKDGSKLKAAYEKLKEAKSHGHEEFIEDE